VNSAPTQSLTQSLTQYGALYESLKSRRLRPTLPKGLDKVAARAGMWGAAIATRRSRLVEDARVCDTLAPELRSMSEAALDDAVARIREVFVRGRAGREEVRRGLATVREVARRLTGEEAYPVQLLGALALYHGRVIEMLTGEGKTLTGSLAAPLLAWRHRRVHVFTVNDYLAKRDAQSRRAIFRRCLLDGGAITHEMEPGERAEV
jgi:preprotein translocase subunit SecA